MKMTKIFAVALAALTIASCSKSEEIGGSNNGTGGEEINTPTYATFKFNIGGPSSRAVADFNPATAAEADAADKKIGGDLQLLIFNAVTQKLEHNSLVAAAGGSKTVLLTAGRKKIFVVANNDKLPYKALIEPTNAFKVGVKSLSDFYALNFDAGTPQQITANQVSTSRDFDFSLLHTLSNTTGGSEAGLPMSNTNEVTYTLVAGISEADAKGGTAATGGTSATNSFNIKLYYMVAKARLVLADGVLEPTGDAVSDPIIQNVTYSIRNLARATNYTQNVPTAGSPQSFYYAGAFTESSTQANFDPEFDYASNLSVTAGAIATPGNYLYVPENNHSMLRRGQSSYFAIKAEFQPVVISVVDYDINNFVKYTYAKLATADAANKNYIYTTKDVQGIPAGTYFLNVELLEEAAWMMKNKVPFVENTQNRAAAKLLVTPPDTPAPYMSFTNGTSYYRVDLGDGAGGAETTYGVLRSNKYDATINSITGPGVPSEQDLIIDPHAPVSARTYISATITAAEWNAITQSADL